MVNDLTCCRLPVC